MTEGVRKAIRFEVLNRDGFTCQYCGKKPPEVVLHVDHIIPRSKGGTDALENLITSCQPCNIGKGAKLVVKVESPPSTVDQKIETAKKVHEKLLKLEDEIEGLALYWATMEGQDPDADEFSTPWDFERSVGRFLKHIPARAIQRAIDIAFEKCGAQVSHRRFRYFCGICWRAVRGEAPPAWGENILEEKNHVREAVLQDS